MSNLKLKELPPVLVRNYLAGVNTFVRGKPAMGKTQTIGAFVEQMKTRIPEFQCWQFYAPTMSPMDIQASAPNYETHLLELFNNGALPNAYTHPAAKGVVFLGELPNADQATAKLLQKYVNGEDMSGVLRKPEGVHVIADGNRIEDKSGVVQQGRAFMSRFEQLEAYTDATDNTEYAAKHGWHPAVQLFFKDNPALIDNYDEVFETSAAVRQRNAQAKQHNGADTQSEEGKQGIWANMRAWERVSRKEYVADELGCTLTLAEVAGNVGTGPAVQYDAHKKVLAQLPAFDLVMANPDKAPMPKKLDEVYQMAVVIALKCTEAQLPAVKVYASRMPLEMQVVVLRTMTQRKGFNLVGSSTYMEWVGNPELCALVAGV